MMNAFAIAAEAGSLLLKGGRNPAAVGTFVRSLKPSFAPKRTALYSTESGNGIPYNRLTIGE